MLATPCTFTLCKRMSIRTCWTWTIPACANISSWQPVSVAQAGQRVTLPLKNLPESGLPHVPYGKNGWRFTRWNWWLIPGWS
ncbi:hypothetical protein KIF59_07605 [Enterobacter cloacae subsp. cloacae]|nr:hypothetical protein [Enterobacter cloacae subsp. cloacae]